MRVCYINAFALSLVAFCRVTNTSQAQLILCTTPDRGQVISNVLTWSITASTLTRREDGAVSGQCFPQHGGLAPDSIEDRLSLSLSWQPGPSHDLAPISGLVHLFKAHEEGEKCTGNVACAQDTAPNIQFLLEADSKGFHGFLFLFSFSPFSNTCLKTIRPY